jgi:hypothetical protein
LTGDAANSSKDLLLRGFVHHLGGVSGCPWPPWGWRGPEQASCQSGAPPVG